MSNELAITMAVAVALANKYQATEEVKLQFASVT